MVKEAAAEEEKEQAEEEEEEEDEEEEEEAAAIASKKKPVVPVAKVRKDHINVVFIGHVGEFKFGFYFSPCCVPSCCY
jgi:hypothetical protein